MSRLEARPAPSRAMMLAYGDLGIRMSQGWGMTESSPIVTVNAPKPACLKLEGEAQVARRCAQGRVVFGATVVVKDLKYNEEEIYTVLSGTVTLHVAGTEHILEPGVFARVGPADQIAA